MTPLSSPQDDFSNAPPPRRRSDTVAGSLTTLVEQQRSLAPGLIALAEDAPSRGLRRSLRELARRLEAGTPLDEALRSGGSVPRALEVAAEAGRQSGRLLPVLNEYQIASEELSRQRRSLWGALSYPLILLVCSAAVIAFLFQWILPQFREVIADFGISLPTILIYLFTISDLMSSPVTLGLIAGLLAAMVALAVGVRFWPPLARLFHWVPLVGTAFYWSGMAEFCRWMSVFVRAETPLASAFFSMGSLIGDPWIGRCARILAVRTERGEPLDEAAAAIDGLPLPLKSVCRWARHGDALPEMLDRSAVIFAEQARHQAEMLRTALVPIIFIGVAGTAALVMFSVMLPMFMLLRALT